MAEQTIASLQASHILTIGIDYRIIRGGVAAVENVYSTFYQPFNHVTTVVSTGQLRKLFALAKGVVQFLGWMLFRPEIKIVHVHGSSDASFFRKRIFINIAKLFRKKVVYHCHGSEFQRFTSQHIGAVNKTMKKCDCIIALSQSWKDWFQTTFQHPNVVVIKNVIAPPKVDKIKHDRFVVIFLGRLGQRKGIYDLMDVLTVHREEFRNKIEFLFGGDGDVEKVQAIIRENGLDEIAQYQGWVDAEKKIRLLNMADAYILPSYNEGLPISVLEAMSYELPILSTNVGGIPEIVENEVNGFLFEAGDKEAIYQSLVQLMNQPETRKSMGLESKRLAREHLPEFVAKQLDELYTSLLNNR